MITAALLAAALLAQTPAPADLTPAAQPPGATAAVADKSAMKPEDDPVVCRTEAVVGSRLPVRTCRHKSAWDIYTRRSREATEEVQTRGRGPFYDH